MKNTSGLLIALALGAAGAMLNWFYLERASQDVERVAFIGIAPATTINRGDTLRAEHLVPVQIPKNAIGDLQNFAVLFDARQTVIGRNAVHAYNGGELLLRQDLRTPPPELKLTDPDERAMWIPVDTATFVPSLVSPGDRVSFILTRSDALSGSQPSPTPATEGEPTPAAPPRSASNTEIIGPFRILSLGNRLGSAEVMQAARLVQIQENVMTIGVRVQGDVLEPKAQKLWNLLRATNFRQVGVLLHPRTEAE